MLILRVLRQLHHQGWKLGIVFTLGISSAIASSRSCVLAQNITTDGTLGPALTLTGPTYNILPGLGQTVGSNLFHSFSVFNLNQGEIADFQSGSGIKNILARVTGGNLSRIDGQMFTSSADVNLFFINPYGIIFGPNSSLDVGGKSGRGAFVATTVDALVWPNGSQFSATNPGGSSSLLTIVGDPGGFLASSRTPGPISNLGGTLEVYDNQRLILLGGNVTLSGGELKATGGQVEIGAVGGAGQVALNLESTGKALGFSEDLVRADVLLTNAAKINATTGQNNGTGTGNIRILGSNVVINDGTQLDVSSYGQTDAGIVIVDATKSVAIAGQSTSIFSRVEATAEGDAGGIGITAKSFSLTDGAQLTTSTFGIGNTGVVAVRADQVLLDRSAIFSAVRPGAAGDAIGILIEANSITLNNQAKLETITESQGDAGLVSLQTNGGSIVFNNSDIFSSVEAGGVGKGGKIEIETGSLSLTNGSQLQTIVRTGGTGDPGVISVEATEFVSLSGISPTSGKPSGIFSVIDTNAQGGFGSNQFAGGIFDALLSGRGNNIVGSIFIDTGSISLTDGAQINTSTDGKGNAGAIIVQARNKASLTNGGAILSSAGENAEGNGGAILMGAGELSIEGTADNRSGLTTQTNGQGDAGLIYVEADRDISVKGDRSGFFSTVEGQGTGTAGGIIVNARSLFLRDGAQVSVNNQKFGEAGGILINTQEDILLLRNAEISATTLSGEGGDIELNVGDFLVLLGNSNISTTAGQAPGGGNGGNIRVNIDRPRATGLWGLPVNDSNITAQAYTGNGGSIRVNARRLYSIARRPLNLNTNDINASSTYGQEGLIEINDVNIDPTQGLNNLPQAPVDTTRLIAPRCNVRREYSEEVNKFTITGRGGIPSSPNDTLQGESVETNWVTTDPPMENLPEDNSSTNPGASVPSATSVPKTPKLVEAQGWVYGSHGEVILTAKAPTATPHSSSLIPTASCTPQLR